VSKPFSEGDLAAQLTRDITWRIREISDLKAAAKASDTVARPALLRALVTISYAHWEGHVRFSARKYLMHVALRKLPFSGLDLQFLRNYFLPRLGAISQKGFEERGQLVDAILAGGSNRFTQVNEGLINTKSNLNHEVLLDICRVCGSDPAVFAPYENFIDVLLLKRRNSIAHGEDTFIAMEDLDTVSDTTIMLMRTFSNELQAKAYLGTYRAVA
jgi:MAE_28990/MAE_18760-like HEPN